LHIESGAIDRLLSKNTWFKGFNTKPFSWPVVGFLHTRTADGRFVTIEWHGDAGLVMSGFIKRMNGVKPCRDAGLKPK